MKLIAEIKDAQKSGNLNQKMKDLLDFENFDLTLDHSQEIELPANFLENKAALRITLEEYGKLEYFKPNPKEKKAELKFVNPDGAIKLRQNMKDLAVKFSQENTPVIINKIQHFEDVFLKGQT